MYSFSQYVNNMIKSTILYFLLLFVVLNVGLVGINNAYKEELILQKEDAFIRIVEHLYEENGLEYVIEYTEHYGHIHNTNNIIKFNDNVVFSTGEEGSFREYNIGTSLLIMVDSTESTNSQLTSLLFYVSNVSLVIVFVVGSYLFYFLSKRKVRVILDDIQELKSSFEIVSDEFNFSFKEFEETYREYRRMNRELMSSSLIKKDKLRGIYHDMNTSLTIIKSYLEGFRTGRMIFTEMEIKELLEEVEFNSRLVFSLLGEGESNHTVDLSNLVNNILNKYNSIFSTKNITLEYKVTNEVFVKGNRDDFKRIIQNILSNAYYYSDNETMVNVTLSVNDGIEFSVEDEGIGLDEEEIKLIFDKEYRSEEAIKRYRAGKGIGLYTSRALMREYNGDIHLIRKEKGIIVKISFSS